MKYERFEDIPIWKEGMRLSREVYKLTKIPPFSRDFGLKDQLQRAMVSISSNIAEGFELNNNNEFIKYLGYSKGSTGEARTQLYIAIDLDYVEKSRSLQLLKRLNELNSRIGGFISYLKSCKHSGQFKIR